MKWEEEGVGERGHAPFTVHLYGPDRAAEFEFCNAALTVVVPDDDAVGLVLGAVTSANEGENVAVVDHFDNTNAFVELWKKRFGKCLNVTG